MLKILELEIPAWNPAAGIQQLDDAVIMTVEIENVCRLLNSEHAVTRREIG